MCFRVLIPNSKTKISREFFVTSGDIEGINLVDVVRQYINLRPKDCNHSRFFVTFRNGNYIKQPIGINTIGNAPKLIAEFLKLPDPKQYTGHCFRRSSTSLLADSGADLLMVKRHGGWKSNSVAEGYIETSLQNKKNTAVRILGGPSTSTDVNIVADNSNTRIANTHANSQFQTSASGISLNNCHDCVININYK